MNHSFPPGTRVRTVAPLGGVAKPGDIQFVRIVPANTAGIVVEDTEPYGWVTVMVDDVFIPTLPRYLEIT